MSTPTNIYPRKVAQKSNFETHPKVDTVEPKIYSVLQEIAHERGSDHKANQQDQYVEFNVSELNEEANPDHPNCNRRARKFIEESDLSDQSLPQTSQQRVKKIIQLRIKEVKLR